MGHFEYAVVPFPSSPYVEDMRDVLGSVLDVGVNVWGCTGEQIVGALVTSGLAAELERLNPVYVAGKSSYELLDMMRPLLPVDEPPEPVPRLQRTPDYWLGWALGLFLIETGCALETVFRNASYEELRALYWPLHEAPDDKFVCVLSDMLEERRGATGLRRRREAAGLSQSQLARASGVGLRSIQMYEQRKKDINKAQGITLYALARALRCSMESLLER